MTNTLTCAPAPVSERHHDTIFSMSDNGHCRRVRLPETIAFSLAALFASPSTEAKTVRPASLNPDASSTIAPKPTSVSEVFFPIARRADAGMIARVRELGMLKDGWHRDDSLGASPRTVKDAEMFLRMQGWTNLAHPNILLSEDGEINFLWQTEDLYLDLGFTGDGTYSFFGKAANGEVFLADELNIYAPLPPRLLTLMSAPTT